MRKLALLIVWLFAFNALAQPYQEIDPRSIWKDGSKTTTASIPFAEGLSIADGKLLQFGSDTDVNIQVIGDTLLFNAADTAVNDMQFNADEIFFQTGVGSATFATNITYAVGGSSSFYISSAAVDETTFWEVSNLNNNINHYVKTNFTGTDANMFVVETAGGTDVFKVNTTTPGVTISTLTGLLKGTSGLVSVATPGTDYLAAVAGSDTNFQYNNAGALGGSSFFNYATDNIPTIGDGNAQITSIGTATVSNASPAVVTRAAHGLAIGDRVTFRTSGGLPLPLHPTDSFDGVREYYYVISAGFTSGSFQISLTRGGAAINTTTAGSGTHTLFKYVNYQLDFNSDADALVEWRKSPDTASQWTLSVRRSDDKYFQYPGYAARFAVNATQVTDYESPVAFSAFINAGANTSELYGFWGGVYDQGTAFNISSQAIGILCYNYMGGSNARTIADLLGGDFTSELGSNITGNNAIGGRFQGIVAATSATYTNAYGILVKGSGATGGTITNDYGIRVEALSGATNSYPIFLNAAGAINFRAGTQAIWSSAASTLDTTTNTTWNWKIGANPANGTAGTINGIFNASGLAIGATTTSNYALEVPAYLNSKRFLFNFTGNSAFTGIGAWGGGQLLITNTGTTTAAGTGFNLTMTTSQTAATHTAMFVSLQAASHSSSFLRGLNLSVAGSAAGDEVQGGFVNVTGGAQAIGYTLGVGRGASGGAANAASGDVTGLQMTLVTGATTGQSYGVKMIKGATVPTTAYTIQGWGDYDLLDDNTWDIASSTNALAELWASSSINIEAGTSAVFAEVGGRLSQNTTSVGNITTGEDDLITYSVTGGTLATDGETLHWSAAGTFATSANNKRVRCYFGTDVLIDTTALAIVTAADWEVHGDIIRTGAATQRAVTVITSSDALLVSKTDYTEPTRTLSGAVTLKCTGEATATDDIINKFQLVDWVPSN